MNITENLKNQLLTEFKSEKVIEKLISNKEIYKFSNYNILNLQKIFEIPQYNLFKETNSKKHLNKIYDMIKSNFFLTETNNYLNLIFYPTNKLEEIKRRRESLKEINFNFENINEDKLKLYINSIENLNTKISFPFPIITIEKNIEQILYDKFKISSTYLSKQELEEYVSNEFDLNTIIISDEDLYIDLPVYSLKEFEKIIKGNIIKTNKNSIKNIVNLISELDSYKKELINTIKKLTKLDFNIDLDFEKLTLILNEKNQDILKSLTNKTLNLESEIETINKEVKNIISKKQLSLQGDELLDLLNSGDITSLQEKFKSDTKDIIKEKEIQIIDYYKERKININFIFENYNYPLKLDEEIRDEIIKKIDQKQLDLQLDLYSRLGEFNLSQIKGLWNFIYFFDLLYGIKKFERKYKLNNATISDKIILEDAKNIYLENANPIDYAIGANKIKSINLNNEKVGILTGANSGGKTTLLEMNLQSQILTCIGLGISANSNSQIKLFDEIIYLKKFTGTIGSGAFEQTIRNLVEILDSNSSKFILIDEFEAVTEPGAAARILIMFLKEIIKQDSLCIAASHLGQEIQEYIKEENIKSIRIDGISAKGLDEKGNLITTHQPEFYKLGKSTPELILKRILQDDKFWKTKSDNSKNILEKIIQS